MKTGIALVVFLLALGFLVLPVKSQSQGGAPPGQSKEMGIVPPPPTPNPTPTPKPRPTATPTASPTPTATPTATPSPLPDVLGVNPDVVIGEMGGAQWQPIMPVFPPGSIGFDNADGWTFAIHASPTYGIVFQVLRHDGVPVSETVLPYFFEPMWGSQLNMLETAYFGDGRNPLFFVNLCDPSETVMRFNSGNFYLVTWRR